MSRNVEEMKTRMARSVGVDDVAGVSATDDPLFLLLEKKLICISLDFDKNG